MHNKLADAPGADEGYFQESPGNTSIEDTTDCGIEW